LHGFAVDFAVVGCAGANDVEVSAGFQPTTFDDWLRCGCNGADNVCRFDGGLWGGRDVDRVSGCEPVAEGCGMSGVSAPAVNGVDWADQGDGLDMTYRLFAGADDGESGRVFPGEYLGGQGACRGGSDGGNCGGVEQEQRSAVGGFKKDDDALVRGQACGAIGVEDGDELDTDDIGALGVAGHHAEQAASIGKPDEGAQGLKDAVFGEVAEHGLHCCDTVPHGQERLYLFIIYKLGVHINCGTIFIFDP
jgi:hypothetical protein